MVGLQPAATSSPLRGGMLLPGSDVVEQLTEERGRSVQPTAPLSCSWHHSLGGHRGSPCVPPPVLWNQLAPSASLWLPPPHRCGLAASSPSLLRPPPACGSAHREMLPWLCLSLLSLMLLSQPDCCRGAQHLPRGDLKHSSSLTCVTTSGFWFWVFFFPCLATFYLNTSIGLYEFL